MEQLSFTSIHPGTEIGLVALRVVNLERSLRFYEGILGFQRVEQTPGSIALGTQDGRPLLTLWETPGARPQPQRSTGLYHVAILLPSRAALGQVLARLAQARWPIGQSDHLVSEALYISDPDGNGLEIYRDRPRSSWKWSNGMVEMAVDPLDLQSLLDEGLREPQFSPVLPAGTRVGHIHLQVAEIQQAEHFYHTILGFDITARMPGALFVSAGGYHHHIGLNTWNSRGAGPAPEGTAGLQSFIIAVPDAEALAAVRARLVDHHVPFQEQENAIVVADPWHNQIHIQIAAARGV